MAGKHRFKTSRGETFCTYCGSDGTFSLRNECSYYAQKSPHNFVKMKPAGSVASNVMKNFIFLYLQQNDVQRSLFS